LDQEVKIPISTTQMPKVFTEEASENLEGSQAINESNFQSNRTSCYNFKEMDEKYFGKEMKKECYNLTK
jgi:hypothetical protein